MPYPEKFHAAVDFVSNPHPEAKALSDELRLLLFALYKQATQGPCNEPKPWSWNVIETAKWQGWSQLGDMSKAEAMRHYVHQVEQNQPDWWSITYQTKMHLKSPSKPPEDNGTDATAALHENQEAINKTHARNQKIHEATAEGSWSTPYLSNTSKPLPRYEHGIAFVEDEMFVIGGNCGGRYLNDVWTFDFATLTWTSIACQATVDSPNSPLPPIAGHSVIQWKNALLVVGGHVKAKDMTETMVIRSLDLDSMKWSIVETTGKAPRPRGGHSVTLLGEKLYVFGGEDVARRPLNDFYVLHLETLEWTNLSSVTNAPAARSAHVSMSFMDRYLLFFGGGSVASCFDDLFVFDTERMRWHSAPVKGRKPSPRAGHAGAILHGRWYIVGGGNNASGCTDMAYLDLSQLNVWPVSTMMDDESDDGSVPEGPDLDDIEYDVKWTIVGTIPERSYLASEGMSLISVEDANVLVAFGGYNGRYSHAVSLFRPKNETPVHEYSLESELSSHLDSGTPKAANQGKNDGANQQLQRLQSKLDAVNKNAAAAKEAASQELALMRRQLVSTQAMLQEKDAALNQSKEQLSQQQAKTFRLEAEVAELRNKLDKVAELEKELKMYRQKQQVAGNTTGGLWGWVAGE